MKLVVVLPDHHLNLERQDESFLHLVPHQLFWPEKEGVS